MAWLERISAAWSGWIVAASWQLAVLVGLVAGVAFVARRRSARFRYALWTLVLLKAFLPTSLAPFWGVGNWGIRPLVAQVQKAVPGLSAPQQTMTDVMTPEAVIAPEGAERTPGVFRPYYRKGTKNYDPTATWSVGQAAFLAWLAGLGGLLGFVGLHYGRLIRSLRTAKEVDEGALRVELERLALELRQQNPPALWLSDRVSSPVLFGIRRPRIVLPASLPASLSEAELRTVLLHELIHWKRRDTLLGWVQMLVQGLFWFHPLIWFANLQIRHERERACDETVLAHSDCIPKEYGESLLKVLLASEGRSAASLAFLGIFERSSRIHHRLEAIMSYRPDHRKFRMWGWVFLAGFAGVFLPMAMAAEAPPGDTYIVAFRPAGAFQPKTAQELLDAFNEKHPQGIRTHHFRTGNIGVSLVGYICVDGDAGRDAVKAMLEASPKLSLLQINKATPAMLETLREAGEPSADAAGAPKEAGSPATPRLPAILSTSPKIGQTDVDPATKEITVTFDCDMGGGMSWTGGGPVFPPIPEGQRPHWRDKRTCVLPVKLERGHFYRVGINAQDFRNFRSDKGIPVDPQVIYFVTQGADAAEKTKATKPRAVTIVPANGAKNVSPSLKELRVTFNVGMGPNFTWAGGGPNFPKVPRAAFWTDDRMSCVLPVELQPNWTYHLGLNAPSFNNFQSQWGVPLDPVPYTFSTGGV